MHIGYDLTNIYDKNLENVLIPYLCRNKLVNLDPVVLDEQDKAKNGFKVGIVQNTKVHRIHFAHNLGGSD